MYFGMNWTEAFRNVSKVKRKACGRNSFRNVVKIKTEVCHGYFWPSCLHKDIRYVMCNLVRFLTYKQSDVRHILYVKLFMCQKPYQIAYNVSYIFVQI